MPAHGATPGSHAPASFKKKMKEQAQKQTGNVHAKRQSPPGGSYGATDVASSGEQARLAPADVADVDPELAGASPSGRGRMGSIRAALDADVDDALDAGDALLEGAELPPAMLVRPLRAAAALPMLLPALRFPCCS